MEMDIWPSANENWEVDRKGCKGCGDGRMRTHARINATNVDLSSQTRTVSQYYEKRKCCSVVVKHRSFSSSIQ